MTLLCLFSLLSPSAATFAAWTEIAELCVGDIVYSAGGEFRGRVVAIYNDGTVGVQYEGDVNGNGYYRQRSSVLGRTKGRLNGISVEDGFESLSGKKGHIRAVYLDGRYCVHYEGDAENENSIAARYEFSRSWGLHDDGDRDRFHHDHPRYVCDSIRGFRLNDGVFGSSGLHGTVTALDCERGVVIVTYSDGSKSDESPSAIGRDNGCIEIRSCVRHMSYVGEELIPQGLLLESKRNENHSKGQKLDSPLDIQATPKSTSAALAI